MLYSTAEIECLLTSPFSSELVHVLKQCVEGEKDILAEALEIIGILVENGWLITCIIIIILLYMGCLSPLNAEEGSQVVAGWS